MLVAELGEGVCGGGVGGTETVLLVGLMVEEGEFADAAHAGDMGEESGVRAGHVLPDLFVEALVFILLDS